MWIAGLCSFAALFCYLLMLGASAGKNWEQEDIEQTKYLQEHRQKKAGKSEGRRNVP